MSKRAAFLLVLVSSFFFLSFVIFIVNNIVAFSNTLAEIHPVLGSVIKYSLAVSFLIAIFWLAGSYFLRPRSMSPPVNPSPEEREAFLKALDERLNNNRHVALLGGNISTLELKDKIGKLDELARKEIHDTSKKVFLSTAISQNGRLDSLIVFCSMASLIWRISRIYNQRPSAREVLVVYRNVVGSSFISYGIDEIDIKPMIDALLEPLLYHAVGHIPFLSSITSSLANAFFHGTTNCIMVTRVGVMTMYYLNVGYDSTVGLRRSSINDSIAISREIIASSFGDLKSAGMELAVKRGAALFDKCAGKAGGTLGAARTAVIEGVKAAGDAVANAGTCASGVAAKGLGKAGEAIASAGGKVAGGAKTAGTSALKAGGAAVDAASSGLKKTGEAITAAGGAVAGKAIAVAGSVTSRVKKGA